MLPFIFLKTIKTYKIIGMRAQSISWITNCWRVFLGTLKNTVLPLGLLYIFSLSRTWLHSCLYRYFVCACTGVCVSFHVGRKPLRPMELLNEGHLRLQKFVVSLLDCLFSFEDLAMSIPPWQATEPGTPIYDQYVQGFEWADVLDEIVWVLVRLRVLFYVRRGTLRPLLSFLLGLDPLTFFLFWGFGCISSLQATEPANPMRSRFMVGQWFQIVFSHNNKKVLLNNPLDWNVKSTK